MITHIELAVIAVLVAIPAADVLRSHWREIKNWHDRRMIHRRAQQ